MVRLHVAVGANAHTQQCTPFPLATTVSFLHVVINFKKKKNKKAQARQEWDSNKTQGLALRPGSKIHSPLRSAKKGKAIGNGSQTGAGREEREESKQALDWFLSNPVITKAKSVLPGRGAPGGAWHRCKASQELEHPRTWELLAKSFSAVNPISHTENPFTPRLALLQSVPGLACHPRCVKWGIC